jgi:hypothetical protein
MLRLKTEIFLLLYLEVKCIYSKFCPPLQPLWIICKSSECKWPSRFDSAQKGHTCIRISLWWWTSYNATVNTKTVETLPLKPRCSFHIFCPADISRRRILQWAVHMSETWRCVNPSCWRSHLCMQKCLLHIALLMRGTSTGRFHHHAELWTQKDYWYSICEQYCS